MRSAMSRDNFARWTNKAARWPQTVVKARNARSRAASAIRGIANLRAAADRRRRAAPAQAERSARRKRARRQKRERSARPSARGAAEVRERKTKEPVTRRRLGCNQ